MPKIQESRYWETLLAHYPRSPSIAMCRVPEVEYLASLRAEDPVLDHCCGDGYIADLCYPGTTLAAGVDLDEPALELARRRGKYRQLMHADAGKRIPAADATFAMVFNNSGIEHIDDLDGAIAEIARVLRPGGHVHLNVLNSRYFDWWPLEAASAADYRRYQPFRHAMDETGWSGVLGRHGFTDVRFRDYFPRATAEVLAGYDYRYSAFYFRRRFSVGVALTVAAPKGFLRARWRRLFGNLEWEAGPRSGAGFLVSAKRTL
jgi:SAM-dependent methyltransferase